MVQITGVDNSVPLSTTAEIEAIDVRPPQPPSVQVCGSEHDSLVIEKAKVGHVHKPAPVVRPAQAYERNAFEVAYYNEAQNRRPPSPGETLTGESPLRTSNHTHEYAIEDGFLWYRAKGGGYWKPLYFDGFEKGRIPIFVDADGANLIWIDDHRKLHYKKVLEEFRDEEINFDENADLRAVRSQIEGQPYVAVDINEKNNWEKKWFSLPFLHYLVNAFTGKRLTIPRSVIDVAISHRGRYNDHVEDAAGQHHPVGTGTTTLYLFEENGQDFDKCDPWSPQWSKTTLSLPETANTVFVGQKSSASASTVASLGYDFNLKTGEETLEVVERIADIDTEGANPAIPYGFVKDDANPERRVLPTDPTWRHHPFHLTGKAFVTKNFSVKQTGEGNAARELIVDGTNAQGAWGYYIKQVRDPAWTFVETGIAPADTTPIVPPKVKPTRSTVRNYVGTLKKNAATLENFGRRSAHSKLTLDVKGKKHELDLYRRFALSNFIGIEGFKYDLVLGDDHDELKEIFGKDRAIKVSVKEKRDGSVVISRRGPSTHNFKFRFK